MNDRKRGFTPPWQISRNMFLAEQEVAQLCRYLRPAADSGAPRQAALAARDRLLIEALLFSGLRNSELCGLRIDDALVGTMETVFLVRGTPRQDRTVYIPRSLGVLVEQFVRVHRPQLIRATRARTAASEDRLLVNDRGKPFDRTSLYRRVVATLTAAGLGERASVQLLRHTYGYLAYQRSGGNLLFIQRQMGHAHPMVSSVYAQFCEEDYSEIADRVAEATGTSSSATSELQRSLKK
ncbi:MAG TPA: site-specific integrase, partial [Planctomycetaceae bacterium]|nr:site-specific integrase [Planctomycetaceae bacterium]